MIGRPLAPEHESRCEFLPSLRLEDSGQEIVYVWWFDPDA